MKSENEKNRKKQFTEMKNLEEVLRSEETESRGLTYKQNKKATQKTNTAHHPEHKIPSVKHSGEESCYWDSLVGSKTHVSWNRRLESHFSHS